MKSFEEDLFQLFTTASKKPHHPPLPGQKIPHKSSNRPSENPAAQTLPLRLSYQAPQTLAAAKPADLLRLRSIMHLHPSKTKPFPSTWSGGLVGKIHIFSFDYLSNWIFALNNLSLVNGEFSKFYFIVALASPCFSKKPHASCHICIHVLICVNYCLTVNGKIAHNLVTVFICRMCGIKPLSSNSSLTSKPPT